MSSGAIHSLSGLPEPILSAERARGHVIGGRYLRMLCWCLFGYALLGKTFAYTGVPPLFVGEAMLLWGILVLVRVPGSARVLRTPTLWPLLALFGWCTLRTVPFISQYGILALRDATVFAYGTFAVVVLALIQHRPERMAKLLVRYSKFVWLFVGLLPIWAVLHRPPFPMPTLPWAPDVKLFSMKESDVMVHLGGVLAFWIVGMAGVVSWIWLILMLITVALVGLVDRSGMVAFLFAGGLATLLRPRSTVPWRLLGLILGGMVILWVTNFHYPIPDGKGREFSADQVIENVGSVFGGDSGSESLDSTKEWRMDWWKEIISYTVHGPYRWSGKGFGINLADDDGFRLDEDGTLRSPHSVHMTFLARAGLPGVAIWIATQLVFGLGILDRLVRAWREGDRLWQNVFIFIGCYWGGFVLNASFDVFLEGPMGGIWFWSLYGAGLGAMWVHANHPNLLSDEFEKHAKSDTVNVSAVQA